MFTVSAKMEFCSHIFSFVAKNAGLSDQKAFVETVEQALREQVKNGIDKNALLAAINCYEFKYKEADFGAYPKGLMYGLQALDSWLYDDKAPFMHIEANETFDALKKLVQTDYFEQLVENQILNNTHKSIVSLLPEKGMESRESEKLKEMLAKKKGFSFRRRAAGCDRRDKGTEGISGRRIFPGRSGKDPGAEKRRPG